MNLNIYAAVEMEITVDNFRTPKGYQSQRQDMLTESMEDYLEMICRLARSEEYVRINFLAKQLNVKPSSASKMVAILKEKGYVKFERYGVIKPTNEGWILGGFLLHRHEVLENFFCKINKSENELELIEQIEHYIDKGTVENIEKMMKNDKE